jgi:hypothetical protein
VRAPPPPAAGGAGLLLLLLLLLTPPALAPDDAGGAPAEVLWTLPAAALSVVTRHWKMAMSSPPTLTR